MFYTEESSQAKPLGEVSSGQSPPSPVKETPYSIRGQAGVWPLPSHQVCAPLCKGRGRPDAEGSVALPCPNFSTQETSFILASKHSPSQLRAAAGYCGPENRLHKHQLFLKMERGNTTFKNSGMPADTTPSSL